MSIFWCDYHQRQEDVDNVGYVERADGTAVCDDTPEPDEPEPTNETPHPAEARQQQAP